MAHFGLLLACEHYPHVPQTPRSMDRQLKLWLADLGHKVTRITSHPCFDGEFPNRASEADLWIVSGQPLGDPPCGRDLGGQTHAFLQAAAAINRPIFGIYHGEHVIHDALAAIDQDPPATRRQIRSIRNPFSSFWMRDRLFSYDPSTRRVLEQPRPQALTVSGMIQRIGMAT